MINSLSVWPIVKNHIHVKVGKPLASGRCHRNVEVDASALNETETAALLAEIACCARCGDLISPFRQREGDARSIFYSVTCKITDCMGCARSRAATEALDADCEVVLAERAG